MSIHTVLRAVFLKQDFKSAAANFRVQSNLDRGIETATDVIGGICTLGIYPLIKYLYRALTDKSKMHAKAHDIAPMEQALLLADPEATTFEFAVNDKVYTIAEATNEKQDPFLTVSEFDRATRKTITLRLNLENAKMIGFDQHIDAAYASVKTLRKKSVLISCFDKLTPHAKEIFKSHFILPTENLTNPQAPLLAGDTDGSTARQILMGIHAGMIHLTPEGIEILARLLKEEANTIQTIHTANTVNRFNQLTSQEKAREKATILSDLQRNTDWQGELAKLYNQLTVTAGHTRLIHLGNHIHGQYAINKDVDRELREKLHSHGAIFIAGPQDCYAAEMWRDPVRFGLYAKDTAPIRSSQVIDQANEIDPTEAVNQQWKEHQWKEHQQSILTNVYYDKQDKILYSYHGIAAYKKGEDTPEPLKYQAARVQNMDLQFKANTIASAFGNLTLQQFNSTSFYNVEVSKVAKRINQLPHPPIKTFDQLPNSVEEGSASPASHHALSLDQTNFSSNLPMLKLIEFTTNSDEREVWRIYTQTSLVCHQDAPNKLGSASALAFTNPIDTRYKAVCIKLLDSSDSESDAEGLNSTRPANTTSNETRFQLEPLDPPESSESENESNPEDIHSANPIYENPKKNSSNWGR